MEVVGVWIDGISGDNLVWNFISLRKSKNSLNINWAIETGAKNIS